MAWLTAELACLVAWIALRYGLPRVCGERLAIFAIIAFGASFADLISFTFL